MLQRVKGRLLREVKASRTTSIYKWNRFLHPITRKNGDTLITSYLTHNLLLWHDFRIMELPCMCHNLPSDKYTSPQQWFIRVDKATPCVAWVEMLTVTNCDRHDIVNCHLELKYHILSTTCQRRFTCLGAYGFLTRLARALPGTYVVYRCDRCKQVAK